MRRILWSAALLALVGCEWMLPDRREAPEKPESPWVKPEGDVDPSVGSVRTDVRVPGRFEVSKADVEILSVMGGEQVHHQASLELGAFEVSDVTTMAYPVGFMKFKTDEWTVREHPNWARTVLRGYLRDRVGEPVQLSFDVMTIGELSGELIEPGDSARAETTGSIQVQSRQETLSFDTVFELHEGGRIVLKSDGPIELDLAIFERDDRLTVMEEALELVIDTNVSITFEATLSPTNRPMPTFARTPVTMTSAEELKQELDNSLDRFELMQRRRAALGQESSVEMNREAFEKLEALKERRANAGKVVRPGAQGLERQRPAPTQNRR